MFNIGPMELVILAVVGLILLGPDRLPDLAKDAARMIRTLRDMATGARAQLRDELGPEFADVDLRALNPRVAIQRAVLGDEIDLQKLNPRNALQRAIMGEDEQAAVADSHDTTTGAPLSMDKPVRPAPQPLGRAEQAPFDADAT